MRRAYGWLELLLKQDGVTIPPFPDPAKEPAEKVEQNRQKHYPCLCVPFDKRKALISSLEQTVNGDIRTSSRVLRIDQKVNGVLLHVDTPEGVVQVTSKIVIFAAGRFGPLILRCLAPSLPTIFRRIELGVRIEQPANDFIFKNNKATDVKLITRGDEASEEWRTFWTCRNGEVIETRWNGLRTFSGLTDGDTDSLSNVGIDLRFTSNPENPALMVEIHNTIAGNTAPFETTGDEFCSSTTTFFGPLLDAKFRRRLLELLPKDSLSQVHIYGPCIEGLGAYPDVNEVLKVNSSDVWVAGDATGMFRGLTAALLSGHFIGQQVSRYIRNLRPPEVFIKQSPTKPMTVIFTAQSKAFFYCRDAVCEFVLKQGHLPLNPFRVFEYYLGDRVERNLVRQGNNQLIELADEVWVFGIIADGVLFEIVRARGLHKPVRFFSIAGRSGEIRPLSLDEITFEPEVHSRQIKKVDLRALLSDTFAIKPTESLQMNLSLEGSGDAP
jgi:hypothetical protein